MIINFSDEPIVLDSKQKSIFLAGPTLRGSTFKDSWRKEACDLLLANDFTGIVYVPEFTTVGACDYLEQVDWERQGLMNADIILFYIPRKLPENPGLTTNVEFGYYLAKRPEACILCTPEGSEKNTYLEWLYSVERPNEIIWHDLSKVIDYLTFD